MPRRRARSLVWLLVMAVTVSPSATCWTVAMRERGRRGEQVTSILGIEIAAFLLFVQTPPRPMGGQRANRSLENTDGRSCCKAQGSLMQIIQKIRLS